MATLEERKIAAVVGCLVGDASAMPLHWIYDDNKLKDIIGDKTEVEFWKPSHNPFYRIEVGMQSCYGDQTYVVLKSLVKCQGVNVDDLKQTTYDFFGPSSEYEPAPAESSKTAAKETYPISRPWRNQSIKDFLENFKAGKPYAGSVTDSQMDAVVRMVPVVSLYAGHPNLLQYVEDVVRVTQNSHRPVVIAQTAAIILEQYILNGFVHDAIENVRAALSELQGSDDDVLDHASVADYLQAVLDRQEKPHSTAVVELSKDCHLPGAFLSSLHGVATGVDYVRVLRETIRAGGCNCSRGGFIGACFAAHGGLEDIPESWQKETKRYDEYLQLAKSLAKITQST